MHYSFSSLVKSLFLVATCAVSLPAADMQAAAAAAAAAVPGLNSNAANPRHSRSISSTKAASGSEMVSDSRLAAGSISSSNGGGGSSSNSALAHAMSKRDAEPFKRGAPRFLGKRQDASLYGSDYAELLKKRLTSPRFVGKRQSAPRFVGKREDELAFKEKRQDAPRFVGKRQSAPRFLGKRQSAPRFVGKRQSPPRFVGKRQSPPRFVGKRQSAPRFVGKRQSPPRFVGKRQSAPRFVGKRQSPPRFVGKRQSAPRFVGKRQSPPRFVGKRQSAPRFVGKRQSPPRFVGKRQSAPRFVGKRLYLDDSGLIDLNDKRVMAPRFLGKRFSYENDPFPKRQKGPYVSAEEFIQTYRKSDPYFMGKRGTLAGNIVVDGTYGVDPFAEAFDIAEYSPELFDKKGAPRFLGKRGAPRFLGKRGAPRFLGKREMDVLTGLFQNEDSEDGIDEGSDEDIPQKDLSLIADRLEDGVVVNFPDNQDDLDSEELPPWHDFPSSADDGIKTLMTRLEEHDDFPDVADTLRLSTPSESEENEEGSIPLDSAESQR